MMASSTKYGVAVDVWGAASAAELATGEPAFPGTTSMRCYDGCQGSWDRFPSK